MTIALEQALNILRDNADALRARAALHVAVFGSVARGEALADSDLDVMVEVNTDRHIGLFGYAGLCEDLKDLFPAKVDVANARTLKPLFRESILSDAVYAF
ncbi:MAG TPA: nucleotidyltransferase domain-containing protein [Rhizomicrobium sp.]